MKNERDSQTGDLKPVNDLKDLKSGETVCGKDTWKLGKCPRTGCTAMFLAGKSMLGKCDNEPQA